MSTSSLHLEHLYRSHRHRAVGLARRVLRDAGEAEDVVQEVFVRLFVTPPPFAGRSSHATWLHRVVLNRSLNALRARSRRSTLELGLSPPRTPEDWLQLREQALAFVLAWDALSPRHRSLVWMRDVEGLEYGEIADRLGIPSGTVKSGLSRAREQLRARVESFARSPLAPPETAR